MRIATTSVLLAMLPPCRRAAALVSPCARRLSTARSAWGGSANADEERERRREIDEARRRPPKRSEPPRRGRGERQPRHWDAFPATAEFVYGTAPVRAALTARRRESLYALYHETPLDASTVRLCDELELERVEQPKGRLQEAIGQARAVHQGVALCCSPLTQDVLEAAFDAPLWLALDEVQDPRNLGAIVRSARFFDCPVVSCAKNSAPLSPVASKASSGALEEAPVYEARNLVSFLANSKPHFRVVGAALTPGKRTHREVTALKHFKLDGRPTILVLGKEGTGLRTNVIDACDDLLCVHGRLPPGQSQVDSLNVAVTAALLLHHLDLQIDRLNPP